MLGRPIMALLTLSWSECVRIVEETASMVIIACCLICFTLTIVLHVFKIYFITLVSTAFLKQSIISPYVQKCRNFFFN